jgi:hypothetical protein
MKVIKNIGLYLILIMGSLLLFIGGNRHSAPRSYTDLWDLGHVFLFAVASYLLIRDWKYLSRKSFIPQMWFVIAICLILGITSELIQVNFDRNPDFGDLARDVLGGGLVIFFFARSRFHIPKKFLKMAQVILIILLLFTLFPLTRSLADELISQTQFPVLSDFETPFEKYRWDAYAEIGIDKTVARSGNTSLKLKLNTDAFSGVFLKFFPSNSEQDSLMITCRINDTYHWKRDYKYNDRFNEKYVLKPGWNDISISLENVKKAPKSRFMDLAKIDLIGIFAVRLPKTRIIYIDSVKLN